MFVNKLVLVNPFFESYIHSDFLGKTIFIALVFLSVLTWSILLYKVWFTRIAKKNAFQFGHSFLAKKQTPLGLELTETASPNPFLRIYAVLKKNTIEILNKNRAVNPSAVYLSPVDIAGVQSHLTATIAKEIKHMEANLYILSTVATLAPFLGMLGTVWGILTTFSEPQTQAHAYSNQMMLSGLSLALTTTVLGLIDAIPALIGYNYLRNTIRDFEIDMEGFSTEILASVEMHYRKIE
jgi:biopolymer transport protein TolQ